MESRTCCCYGNFSIVKCLVWILFTVLFPEILFRLYSGDQRLHECIPYWPFLSVLDFQMNVAVILDGMPTAVCKALFIHVVIYIEQRIPAAWCREIFKLLPIDNFEIPCFSYIILPHGILPYRCWKHYRFFPFNLFLVNSYGERKFLYRAQETSAVKTVGYVSVNLLKLP